MLTPKSFKSAPTKFLIALSIALFLVYLPTPFFLQDVSIYRAASTAFFEGKAPYSLPHQLSYITGHYGFIDAGPERLQAWPPPSSLMLYAPMVFLPDFLWKAIYKCLLITFLFCSFFFTQRQFAHESFSKTSIITLSLLFAVLMQITAMWGGVAIFAGFFFFGGAFAFKRKFYFSAGLLYSLTIIKPNLCILIGVWALAKSLRSRNLPLLAGLCSGVIGTVVISYMINPLAWQSYFVQDRSIAWNYASYGSTLGSIFNNHFDSQPLSMFIPTFFLSAVIFLHTIREREEKKISCDTLLTLSVLFAPYGWFHDMILAFPFLCRTSFRNRARNHSWIVTAALSVLIIGLTSEFLPDGIRAYFSATPTYVSLALLTLLLKDSLNHSQGMEQV